MLLNNHAFVTKIGAGNTASQMQHQQAGIAAPQNVTINQTGDGNTATQEQGFGYTGYNDATITQISNDNIGYQKQDGYNMTANMTQTIGDGNNASQMQFGSHQLANFTQTGAANIGTQEQHGINHVATITSVGDGNEAYQLQTGGTYNSPPTYLSGHDATISQDGDFNICILKIRVEYENNSASINQQGSSNNSTQIQSGSSNNAQTVIAGNSNTTSQKQDGNK